MSAQSVEEDAKCEASATKLGAGKVGLFFPVLFFLQNDTKGFLVETFEVSTGSASGNFSVVALLNIDIPI